MPDAEAHPPGWHDLAFFGRILAGQTHELANVLNVIHELTGLEEDVLAAAEQTRRPDVEKLERTVGKIRQQLRRGEALVRALNRLAHSVDHPVSFFDVREALEQTACLAQRAAQLAKTALEREFPADAPALETSRFRFQQAVLMCIELALAAGPPAAGGRVRIGYRVRDTGVDITVTSADPMPMGPGAMEQRARLELLMRDLGGHIAVAPVADAPHCLTLFFPSPRPHARGPGAPSGASAEDSHAT